MAPGQDPEEPGRLDAMERRVRRGPASLWSSDRSPGEGQRAADPGQSDVRNDLALAEDALGQLLMELGESKPAEDAFGRALRLLEPLIAQFPTVPRFREAVAKATNSLGMIEQGDGRWSEAEGHYRRELAEAERLAQDFPDRPEFRRELARTCGNLGGLLTVQGRSDEAAPILRRGVSLNTALAAQQPTDAQIRFDLSRCRNNLGCLLLDRGETDAAIAEFQQARELSAELAKNYLIRLATSSLWPAISGTWVGLTKRPAEATPRTASGNLSRSANR